MTISNSKLTSEQKAKRKAMLSNLLNRGGVLAQSGSFTVVKVPVFLGSRMARFSVAVCSEKEKKFRRKVGEFHALNKYNEYNYVTLPAIISAQEFADSLYGIAKEDTRAYRQIGYGYSTMERFFG